MVAVAWHKVVVPLGALGIPTVGVTVTLVLAATDGPLQPLAVTLMVAVPLNVLLQVTVPVVLPPLIVPAVLGLMDQVYPVALDALAAYPPGPLPS